MSIIKLLGGVLILSAGLMTAISAVYRERKRLAVLDAWIALINHFREQIDLYLTPIDSILETIDRRMIDALCSDDKRKLSLDLLVQSSTPFLDCEAERAVRAIVSTLGASYREEQIKQCEHYAKGLERIREKQAVALPQKTRLYITLCLCAAVGILILLW